jgi:cell division protein FtsI/penicillin-binding protein 2
VVADNNIIETGSRRSKKLFYLIILFSILVIGRLYYLQILKHNDFIERAEDQRQRTITLSPDRGDIVDRNGNILATSIDSYSLGARPREIKDVEGVSIFLSKVLKENKASIKEKLSKKSAFVWIKRKFDASVRDKVLSADIKGLEINMEKKRVYPKGTLASQIIGFVGTDNEGLAGLELSFDDILKGEAGEKTYEQDASRREVVVKEINKATDGKNITLSIDEAVQFKAEKAVKKMVKDFNGIAGHCIVMDAKTGEILALASYPEFDPNEYKKFSSDTWNTRAVKDVYEPGSTFKMITIASALDEGVINKNSKIYCEDSYVIGGRTIRNSHQLKFETRYLSPSDILEQSVNVGVAKIAAEKLGKERFYKKIKDFGFGEKTGIGLPGESSGILYPVSAWNKPDVAMISFGQSISVTPIQLISCLGCFANNGIRVKPILVKKIESPDAGFVKVFVQPKMNRAVSQTTAEQILELSEDVVVNGTGKSAAIDGFRVGGKTGTAQKAKDGKYLVGDYISSFIGFAPLSSPRLVTLVIIDDPKPVYWGERVAAPTFKEITEFALRRLNVVPDKITKTVI